MDKNDLFNFMDSAKSVSFKNLFPQPTLQSQIRIRRNFSTPQNTTNRSKKKGPNIKKLELLEIPSRPKRDQKHSKRSRSSQKRVSIKSDDRMKRSEKTSERRLVFPIKSVTFDSSRSLSKVRFIQGGSNQRNRSISFSIQGLRFQRSKRKPGEIKPSFQKTENLNILMKQLAFDLKKPKILINKHYIESVLKSPKSNATLNSVLNFFLLMKKDLKKSNRPEGVTK